MDHSFSTSGAIRQHHQSIRNSLSPSPSTSHHHHHIYRISPTSNILSAAAAGGNYSPYGKSSPTTPSAPYPTSPQPSNFYRVSTYTPQQQQQHPQYINQFSTSPPQDYSSRSQQYPLRPNTTNNTAVRISPTGNYTQGQQAFSSGQIETTYRTPQQYNSPQFSNPPPSQSQYTAQFTPQQQQQQTMNKNRFVGQHNINGNGASSGQADNGSSGVAVQNVKTLIQQVSQQNNNVNQVSTTQQSNGQQQPQQAQPQYRIFKRGDSIPGISSPIQLSPKITPAEGQTKEEAPSPPVQVSPQEENKNDKENSNDTGGRGSSSQTGNLRTPLSQIGEIARFHGASVEYRLVNETGPPHAPTFTVLLRVGSEEFNGQGPSIKKAQHAAALEALEKTTLSKPPAKSSKPMRKPYSGNSRGESSSGGGNNKRPNWNLIQLTTLAQEMQLPLQFVQQPVQITDPFRRGEPPSIVSVHVGDKVFTGEGVNFNMAKNAAVMVALKAMMKVKQEVDFAKMVQAGVDAEQSMMEADNKSPISIVHEMAMKRGLTVQFEVLKEEGPPHMKIFTVKCKVGEYDTEGEGPTKQAAKKASSEGMIEKLKDVPITIPQSSQGLNLKAMQRGILRQKLQKKKTSTPVVKDVDKQQVSPISRLIQIAHVKKFKEPEFVLISTGTETNVENFLKQITERDRRMLRKKKPVFTIEVTCGPHTCRGSGSNKKAAKKAAAEAALVAMGYSLQEGFTGELEESGETSEAAAPAVTHKKKERDSGKGVKLQGARQIAPGIIVLKSESAQGATGGTTSTAVAQEMKKVGSLMTPCPSASSREGIDKLAYLSKLLEITVSYSDFPKKNEYLSVVSLTTNPPHVAHGCGKTLEEAQNAVRLPNSQTIRFFGQNQILIEFCHYF